MAKVSRIAKKSAPVEAAPPSIESKPVRIGSARGIESMFRNSYRAQLDMIALAATKANIMISLNGVLVSLLLVSGAYFLAADPLLLIPVSMFLVTCTTAIIFAVLAARPDVDRTVKTAEDFRTDRAELLIFDQFSKLSREEYNGAMEEMMQNNERIYANMTAHIYSLGCMANRKFARLHISYNAFIIGLIASVTSLLVVMAYHFAMSV